MLYKYVRPGHYWHNVVFKLLDEKVMYRCRVSIYDLNDNNTFTKDQIGREFRVHNIEYLKKVNAKSHLPTWW